MCGLECGRLAAKSLKHMWSIDFVATDSKVDAFVVVLVYFLCE